MQITKKYDVFVCLVKKSNRNFKNTVKIHQLVLSFTLLNLYPPTKKTS